MKKLFVVVRLCSLCATFLFCSCETQVANPSSGTATARFATAPPDRPGLGTKWGETRNSRVDFTSFHRVDPSHPLATAAIYYNDKEGIRAMMNSVLWRRTWPSFPPRTQSLISIGIKDPIGRFYPGALVGGQWVVIGKEGRRYSIVVRNRQSLRLEVVLSVDGLDVLDGGGASVRKPGYVMAPRSELKVDGFRQNTESVAAFRFSPMRESYAAEKYHNTQNVGIIGVAVFNERDTNPWTDGEVRKRLDANPFPGRLAPPPQDR